MRIQSEIYKLGGLTQIYHNNQLFLTSAIQRTRVRAENHKIEKIKSDHL